MSMEHVQGLRPPRTQGIAPPATMDALRESPAPLLLGEFARHAYIGACEIADLLAVLRNPDHGLQLVAELYLHAMHDVAYAVADAKRSLAADGEDVVILIARLIRKGLVRRQGGLAHDMPLQGWHRIEIAPAWKAELSGFFARAHMRGPASLEDWARSFG